MSLIAVLLLVASAFAHAGWNCLSKKSEPTVAFFFVASITGGMALFPLVLFYHHEVMRFPVEVWWALLASGACLTVYYSGLATGYRKGDMSVVYPLARAIPVLLVALITTFVGKEAPLTHLDIFGILLVVGGCLMTPLQRFSTSCITKYFANSSVMLAVVAACGTAGYSVIDDGGLQALKTAGADLPPLAIALLYGCLQSFTAAFGLFVVAIFRLEGRKNLKRVMASGKKMAGLTGLAVLGTYGMVLTAMMFVTNVSYVVVFRQLSIPIGVCLGILFLGEKANAPKLAGVASIFIGLLLVGLG